MGQHTNKNWHGKDQHSRQARINELHRKGLRGIETQTDQQA